MKIDHLSEKEIEQMLKGVPKITDSRSKGDVYRRLMNDPRLSEDHPEIVMADEPAHKKKKNWLPPILTVAVLILLAIVLPHMLNQSNSIDEASTNLNTASNGLDSSNKMQKSTENSSILSDENGEMVMSGMSDLTTSVYAQNIAEDSVMHLGMASSAGASMPVTFVIPRAQIEADFGDIEPTSYELYMKYAAMIDEEALGFSEYHPYKGEIEVNGDQLIYTMPTEHQYDIASSAVTTFIYSLQDTFYGYKEIVFKDQNGVSYTFAETGEPSVPLELATFSTNHYGYFIYRDNANPGQEYLTPNFNVRYNTATQAMKALSVEENDIYDSVIPTGVEYEVIDNGEVVTIQFVKTLDLSEMELRRTMQMVEAFALTAASFNKQVKLENIVQDKWEGFIITDPIPTPIGPNKIEWDFSK